VNFLGQLLLHDNVGIKGSRIRLVNALKRRSQETTSKITVTTSIRKLTNPADNLTTPNKKKTRKIAFNIAKRNAEATDKTITF